MSRQFQSSLKTLLLLIVFGMSFALTASRSFGEDDADAVATATVQDKAPSDGDADRRLRDALKGTAAELLEMVPISGGAFRMGSPFDVGSYAGGWLIAAIIGDRSWPRSTRRQRKRWGRVDRNHHVVHAAARRPSRCTHLRHAVAPRD